MSLLVNY